ncbi:hypothetical protein QWA68_015259 [Fusarium oxysporum]|nr:hypothetical protein QWA68_015259 [Fusarium oxysporum]
MAADQGFLPLTVVPYHYNIVIAAISFTEWSYQGNVTSINISNRQPTREIVLNCVELELLSAEFLIGSSGSKILKAEDFVYDEGKQQVAIRFPDELTVAESATLKIAFEGRISNDMAGFYRSQYRSVIDSEFLSSHGGLQYMLSTQFEPCDARRAFPCFDEPRLKATFQLVIEVPKGLKALSNMPENARSETHDGRQLFSFERTPRMSTYLLAWAIGDFEHIERFTEKQVPVRIYTTPGLKEQGRYALEHATKTIDLFCERFGIEYPLPKLDLLAVHEFALGAMENWGLITYHTIFILFDENASDIASKNKVAYAVGHEIAHQWFGNLVTMDWWDELWLNESFATWAGWYVVDQLHPDWQIWAQFINESMEKAFSLDGLRESHSIHVPINGTLDVSQIFDAISYQKGCSVLRMLASYLGSEVFFNGIKEYLQKNAFGNATSDSLWNALGVTSGSNVKNLMENWIEEVGHPVLDVTEVADQVLITQMRHLSMGNPEPREDNTLWWVPLGLRGLKKPGELERLVLSGRNLAIPVTNNDVHSLNINANGTGFFRVSYRPAQLATISSQFKQLNVEDKVYIIGSVAASAVSGSINATSLLSFVEQLGEEMNYHVCGQILDSLGYLQSVFGDDEVIEASIRNFVLTLIDQAVEKIGWKPSDGESYLTSLLRKRLLLAAVGSNRVKSVNKAVSLFDAWRQGGSLDYRLSLVVYCAAAQCCPITAFDALKQEWQDALSPDVKEACLVALGRIKDEDVITKRVLPFLFNSSLPPGKDTVLSSEMHFLGASLAGNKAARLLVWRYMRDNWSQAATKMKNPVVTRRFIKVTLDQFSDIRVIDEIDTFFFQKDISGLDRTLNQVREIIKVKAAYRTRDAARIKGWLAANGHLP